MLHRSKKNLFVVLNPFQLMCAQEAREKFCRGEDNYLVIIDRCGSDTPEYRQKNAALDTGWSLVTRHREPKNKGAMRIPARLWNTLRIRMKMARATGKVFLGDPYLKWFRMLGRMFGDEVIWLDDGAASIFVIPHFLSKGCLNEPNETTPKYFSVFSNPKIEAQTCGAIMRNDFALLRQSRHPNQVMANKQAFFIGQWLSEKGGVDQDAELKVLSMAVESLSDWKITYVPHRHESDEKLAKIAKLMPIQRFEKSIEATMLSNEVLPQLFVSWYSTALFTLGQMVPECERISIQVPLSAATEKQKAEWSLVYEALRDDDVEIRDYGSLI
ncbi:hypothetical protein CLV80_102282 [Yoonia maritima]|uniref:Glycosyl transferase family 52 n=1 Tax=Yoonia maritima TaxID=1435347 RepID=A0A2T0W3P9_9RHOB|nr:hypothetical protein [Yoonia maritima]PRY79637.1 hypothetical protein CLV80_102282 [Yoonia maritima]